MAQAQSFAERARARQIEKGNASVAKTGADAREWSPADGKYRIRLLPPLPIQADILGADGTVVQKKGTEDDFFYMTHGYHFFEGLGKGGKGLLLWTPRRFLVDGVLVNDPIDDVVAKMYEVARRENDEALKTTAGKIKRKRQIFANCILYDDVALTSDFKILKDNTNEGKLFAEICKNMGFPFFRDVQDEWVVKESLEVDPDRDTYDLVDAGVEGHDFKIVRTKTGANAWDIDYSSSLVTKKARALTEEEVEAFMGARVDLRAHVEYCTYQQAKDAITEYCANVGWSDEDTSIASITPKTSAQRAAAKPADEDEDAPIPAAKPRPTAPVAAKPAPAADDEGFDPSIMDDLD